jgi:hypothetical protein
MDVVGTWSLPEQIQGEMVIIVDSQSYLHGWPSTINISRRENKLFMNHITVNAVAQFTTINLEQ